MPYAFAEDVLAASTSTIVARATDDGGEEALSVASEAGEAEAVAPRGGEGSSPMTVCVWAKPHSEAGGFWDGTQARTWP